jgi:hypothetical protein
MRDEPRLTSSHAAEIPERGGKKYVIHLKTGYEWPIGPGVNRVSRIEVEEPNQIGYGPDFFGIGTAEKLYQIPIHNILSIEIDYLRAMPSPDTSPKVEPKP